MSSRRTCTSSRRPCQAAMHSAASLKRIGSAWLSGSRMWYRPPYTFFAASASTTAARSAVAHSAVRLRLPKWAAWPPKHSS